MKIDIETLRKTKGIGQKTLERIIEQHEIDNNIRGFRNKYIPSDKYRIDKDINLWQGDCLELMSHIPDKSIDMILADLPYNKTRGVWDTVIPFEPLWSHYKRIIKDNGAIVLFGNEPFSTDLRYTGRDLYLYDWKWVKNRATGFANCNYKPMSKYEDILVFSKANASTGGRGNNMVYNPQGLVASGRIKKNTPKRHGLIQKDTNNVGRDNILMKDTFYEQKWTNYPNNVLEFDVESKYVHPTQKPVELLEYLIKTYTNEDMLVLDNTMGSGSTGIACKNLSRRFIGIELDEKYFDVAMNRMESV